MKATLTVHKKGDGWNGIFTMSGSWTGVMYTVEGCPNPRYAANAVLDRACKELGNRWRNHKNTQSIARLVRRVWKDQEQDIAQHMMPVRYAKLTVDA